METTILRVAELTKRYRRLVAVNALSFTLKPGEFVGFIGPNGAGKSTTMGMIAGALNPDSGTIHVAGHDVLRDAMEGRRRVSFVPQHLELYDYLTGLEYMHLVAHARELSVATRDVQVAELFEMAELDRAKHRLIKEYSGGMARKLAICGALLGPPDLLLLDESFVGLDPESTFALQQRLKRFCAEGGAVLLSSHILDMLERLVTRVVMLSEGELVLDASIETLREGFLREGGPDDLTTLYLELSGKQPPPTPS